MQETTIEMNTAMKSIVMGNCDMSGYDGRTINGLAKRGLVRKNKSGKKVTATAKGRKRFN